MAEHFEDLRVWQTARALTNAVYKCTNTGSFSKDFGLRDQIQRAAVRVMSNIAPQEHFFPAVRAPRDSKAGLRASLSTTSAKPKHPPAKFAASSTSPKIRAILIKTRLKN
ncbi:four helix bundle protein [Salinibacter altiplanensis]|uniref:four helix bundle protein n=1 Tax=Salinibacter altiplanensis TaxID=1803181 RepID=UPI001F209566